MSFYVGTRLEAGVTLWGALAMALCVAGVVLGANQAVSRRDFLSHSLAPWWAYCTHAANLLLAVPQTKENNFRAGASLFEPMGSMMKA